MTAFMGRRQPAPDPNKAAVESCESRSKSSVAPLDSDAIEATVPADHIAEESR